MIFETIGIILGIIFGLTAIGLFFYLKNDQQITNTLYEGDLEAAKQAYKALMEDFNHYQIKTNRKTKELEDAIVIKAREQDKNLTKLTENLPSIIGRVVGQIEFAQDKITRRK